MLSVLGWIVFGDISATSAIGLAAIVIIAPIFLLKTEYGLYALLIFRPIIDIFSGYGLLTIRSVTINLTSMVAILVIVWFLVILLRERVELSATTQLGWLIGVLIWGAATLGVSLDTFISLSEWLRLSSIVIIFIIAYHVATTQPHSITRLTPVLAVALVIPLAAGLVQLITATGLSFGGLDNRVYGTFGHPNVFGFYLVCIINLLLITQLTKKPEQRSLIYPWLIGLGLVMLLFTYTRGAWIGFVVIQILIGLKYYRKQLLTIATVLVGAFLLWQVINTVTINTFNYDLNKINLLHRLTSRDEEADSIDWRLQVFQTMAPQTLNSPLLGYGLGNFVTLRQQGDIGLFDDPEAHNDYLRLAIETGFVGLALYLGFWLGLLVTLFWNYVSHHEDSWQKHYALFGMALIIAALTISVSDNLLQGTAVMWTYMTVLAMIVVETRPHGQMDR
ncbi:MAG: O-antigen ligase family protein [Patescibacteria group bacterium]